MGIITRVQESFGFTRNEVNVVLFLAVSLLLGAAIRSFISSSPPPTVPPTAYLEQDRVFAERSNLVGRVPGTVPAAGVVQEAPGRRAAFAPVNLNTATRAELMRLPGIGPAFADRIIRYREEHGPFGSTDDLDRVPGIGRKKIERLRPFVLVR